MIRFTKDPAGLPETAEMAEKAHQPSFDTRGDIGTDYALIAVGVTVALIALIYLLLI